MASPIIGALYFGFVSATVTPGTTTDVLAVHAVPTPQCVVCGPAKRHTLASRQHGAVDRSNVRFPNLVSERFWRQTADQVSNPRVGITAEQMQRLLTYAGA